MNTETQDKDFRVPEKKDMSGVECLREIAMCQGLQTIVFTLILVGQWFIFFLLYFRLPR